jgi:hypothetical protein
MPFQLQTEQVDITLLNFIPEVLGLSLSLIIGYREAVHSFPPSPVANNGIYYT